MSPVTRRGWLLSSALIGSVPCACLAKSSQDCCTVPELPADGVRLEPDLITIDLKRSPALAATGGYARIVDAERKRNILVAHTDRNRFVALDQRCTHGGGALTYVHKHKHIYCTCWGHSKFALDGSVLRWPNKQPPRPLRAYTVERKGDLLEIRGLA